MHCKATMYGDHTLWVCHYKLPLLHIFNILMKSSKLLKYSGWHYLSMPSKTITGSGTNSTWFGKDRGLG